VAGLELIEGLTQEKVVILRCQSALQLAHMRVYVSGAGIFVTLGPGR
jgi:hypothetical protein